jgi:hypothetical protein
MFIEITFSDCNTFEFYLDLDEDGTARAYVMDENDIPTHHRKENPDLHLWEKGHSPNPIVWDFIGTQKQLKVLCRGKLRYIGGEDHKTERELVRNFIAGNPIKFTK